MMFRFLLFSACASATPSQQRGASSGVPSFAVQYAPVAYLYSGENYKPADIGAQLVHTQPEVNYTAISDAPTPLTLNNLNQLNNYGDGGKDVYLTSRDNVTTDPAWLHGVTPNTKGKTVGAKSGAIIVNDHGSGLVDVFYFYFYAFDFGGIYFGFNIGNHVGDWEHTMVRFSNGQPQAVWYSQHSNGEAFEYSVVEKFKDRRPVVYIANGTHANYATPGTHDHAIPNLNLPAGAIADYTDQGAFWDPIKNALWYSYDANSATFTPYRSGTPTNWLYYLGRWGDLQYPDDDPRQSTALDIDGLQKYVSGPTGPADKQLNRTDVCPDNGNPCIVRPILGP